MQQNPSCFIDYCKAFDNVKHENLHLKQAAAIRIGNHAGEHVEIKKGVTQGCVMSPDLLNLCSQRILRELEDMQGLAVRGNNINNLHYSDGTVLVAKAEEQLHVLVDKLVLESAKKRLCLNTKRQCMIATKKRDIPTCNF